MGIERVWFAKVADISRRVAGGDGQAGTGAPAAAQRRLAASNAIAVMAFEDLSPAQDQSYFSDGMSEEILNALTRIRELRVLGRSSSFQYKGKDVDPRRIGAELGVPHILDGSVRRQGDLVRIAATLISTVDGAAQWTKEYNGKLADLFDLQDNCAHDIAAELKIVLTGGQRPLVDKSPLIAKLRRASRRDAGQGAFRRHPPRAIGSSDGGSLDLSARVVEGAVAFAVPGLSPATGGRTGTPSEESAAARGRSTQKPRPACAQLQPVSQRRAADMVEPMARVEIDPNNETARYRGQRAVRDGTFATPCRVSMR
jgi:TolB-like protein